MIRLVHPLAGILALLIIATFWLSTAASELLGTTEAVVLAKTAIPWGFLLLVPALAATGGSGAILAAGRKGGRLDAKRRRMAMAAANGLLVLVPSALFLAWKAELGEFDAPFYGIQALELAAGALNILLLGLNLRDGLAMTGRLRRRSRQSGSD